MPVSRKARKGKNEEHEEFCHNEKYCHPLL